MPGLVRILIFQIHLTDIKAEAIPMSNKTVLVVEDNKLNMKLVVTLLKIGKYAVLEAPDAGTGIRLAQEHLPDLILMDIQLPDMDGLSATRLIKSDPKTDKIPVVALTAYAMSKDEQATRDAGCDGYLSKPIDTKEFLKTITNFISGNGHGKNVVASGQKASILIVDDDVMNVKLLNALLSPDYHIFKAYGGSEALEIVREKMPDLILLDIMMPGINGYEVTRQLKSDPQTRNIPIILVTALGGDEDKAKGIALGADEFLNKPVNQTELKARVKSLLKLKVYQEQLTARIKSEQELVAPVNQPDLSRCEEGLSTVLLVEDSEKDRNLFKLYLEGQPYRLRTVRSGEEAIAECEKNKVDLVVLDLLLPGLDGFDVCRKLRETEQTRNIQILMVSNQNDLECKLKGLELGADEFLIKPIDREELIVRIRSLVRKKRYVDQLLTRFESALNSAITDKLTGLYNHAYLMHFLDHEIKRSRRQNHHMALIMIDIDDFKHYNDTYGHPAGDTFLQLFGQLIKTSIREVDLAARYGGEEFAVVLPYTDCKGAKKTAERILGDIRNCSLSEGPSRLWERKTASMGIACYPGDGESVAEVIQRADEALYEAKHQGKNQICQC